MTVWEKFNLSAVISKKWIDGKETEFLQIGEKFEILRIRVKKSRL